MPIYPLSHGHCSALSRMNQATRYVLEDYLRNVPEEEIAETARQWFATNDPHARRHFACALMEDYWGQYGRWDPESRMIQRFVAAGLRRVQWRVLAAALLARAAHELPEGSSWAVSVILQNPHVPDRLALPRVETN